MQFSEDALGWFNGTIWPQIGAIAIIIAFGHSLLSMSGFETLAQVYREIAYPEAEEPGAHRQPGLHLRRLLHRRDHPVRGHDHPGRGARPVRRQPARRPRHAPRRAPLLRFAFHVFVVVVGVLILSGAVNTSIIGANGVMNRLAEDGVLVDWFRKPHKTLRHHYRLINMIALHADRSPFS